MQFYVWESSIFEVTVGVPALDSLQGCLSFELQQATSILGSKKGTLPFEYALVEVPADDSLETNCEEFTSDSDAAPDVDEVLVAALAEDLHPYNDDYSAHSFWGSKQEISALKKKLNYLSEHSQKILVSLLHASSIVA